MNPLMKKALFVAGFVVATLVLPMIVLLIFVDASMNISAYFIVYGLIIFSILGYVIVSVRNMEKKLEDTLDEIKMQNAAIAHKLTNFDGVQQSNNAKVVTDGATIKSTANIPLNPAEPLVAPTKKVTADEFNDFK